VCTTCVRRVHHTRRSVHTSCVWRGNSEREAVIVIQPPTGSSRRGGFEDEVGENGVVRTCATTRARAVSGDSEHPAPRQEHRQSRDMSATPGGESARGGKGDAWR